MGPKLREEDRWEFFPRHYNMCTMVSIFYMRQLQIRRGMLGIEALNLNA